MTFFIIAFQAAVCRVRIFGTNQSVTGKYSDVAPPLGRRRMIKSAADWLELPIP
jgi:hypothetical protein